MSDPEWFPSGGDAECRDGLAALQAANQGHIFESWKKGEKDEEKIRCLKQAATANREYPGGLKRYYENALALLEDSRLGKNPLEGYVPEVPKGSSMFRTNQEFDEMTQRGISEIPHSAFVLVAGGLGERLGYPDIKLSLPVETVTSTCFLELYISFILAWQRLSGAKDPVPLVIMTSDDTDSRTRKLLQENNNFGMVDGQVVIVKQGKVPAIEGNSGRFAMDPNTFALITKPHGHGDVHQLLYSSNLTGKWNKEGRKHVIFMQDTHSLVVYQILATLGVSVSRGFDMNMITVPRKPGEASGSICLLKKEGAQDLTINVEYNQLDPLLRATLGHGDEAGPDGFSPYPGNVNSFVLNLEMYHEVLQKSEGMVPEFVNPKYTDDTRTAFKSPTRLECMMQDIPKFFPGTASVGFTSFERWLYCPVKNATADGAKKQTAGQLPSCAVDGESAWCRNAVSLLRDAGANVEEAGEADQQSWLGVKIEGGAIAVLDATFATTRQEVRRRIDGLKMSKRSVLVVKGDVIFKNVVLDGTLVVEAAAGAQVVLDGISVTNKGWEKVAVPESEDTPSSLRIRGYTYSRDSSSAAVLKYTTPGVHTCNELPKL